MILTCPNCNVQFNLDDDLLGEQGRKVKCSSCEEIWFQEPENIVEIDFEESVQEEAQEEAQEEPEPEEEIEIAIKPVDNISDDKGKIISIAIAASVFLVIFVYLLANSASFIQKNPSTRIFYALFGVNPEIEGQNLAFDQVIAKNNGKTIDIRGKIINLEAVSKKVPVIELSLMDDSDIIIAKWYIAPPKDILEPEGSISFDSLYDIELPENESLNAQVKFVINAKKLKTGEVSDASNPAPHQGESDHQSDHEESSKPHQVPSSAPHQESSHH